VSDTPTLKDKWPSILATVIIAPSSAWLLSFAGVYGTLTGVLIGSALSGTGGALIERWIRLSHTAAARKLAEHKAAAAHGRKVPAHAEADDPWESYYRPAAAMKRFDIPWRKALVWGLAAVLLSGGSVAVAQAISHRTASDLVSGTTRGHRPAPQQTSAPVPSYSPSPVVTGPPSPTPTPSPTVTASPTLSPTPAPSPSPAPSPTPSPIVSK
jgi:hypothetical protein